MKNIAIIFIGTSKYKQFFDGFYEGLSKNFTSAQKTYFVFTDDADDQVFNKKDVICNKIEHLGWPWITLYRFKFINSIKEKLALFDNVFFIDADLWCVNNVKDEILDFDLVGVQHPGFYNKIGTFETNSDSTASIFDNFYDVSTYYQGCFWGGKTQLFLEMTDQCEKNVDLDLKKNIVAVWHDESHMNKHFLKNKQKVYTLHPGYAQPQHGYDEIRKNFQTIFVHLHKDLKEFPRFAGIK